MRRRPRSGHRPGDRAQRAAGQRPDRSPVPATRKPADGGTRASTNRGASERALSRIIGIAACGQYQRHTAHRRGQFRAALHQSLLVTGDACVGVPPSLSGNHHPRAPKCECVVVLTEDVLALPALTAPAVDELLPRPVVSVVWLALTDLVTWPAVPAVLWPELVAVTIPCAPPDVLPRPVVIDVFRAPAVANEWLPPPAAAPALPAVTMLWVVAGELPRPVVTPVFRAPAVVNEWPLLPAAWVALPPVTMLCAVPGTLPRPVVTLVFRAPDAVDGLLAADATWLVLPAVTVPAAVVAVAWVSGVPDTWPLPVAVWTLFTAVVTGAVWPIGAVLFELLDVTTGPLEVVGAVLCTLPDAVVVCPPPLVPPALAGPLPEVGELPPAAVVVVWLPVPEWPPEPAVGPLEWFPPVDVEPAFCCGVRAPSGSVRVIASRSDAAPSRPPFSPRSPRSAQRASSRSP